jgi:D-glycero-D-manno-heptose 1,7-bisphosphate phosphatase
VGINPVNRAVFLDRDGVLNRVLRREGQFVMPASAADVEILPGVHEALRELKAAGYALIVVTNQPDVARGRATKAIVGEINDYLSRHLPLDDIRVCFHDDSDGCGCRKPKPGLLSALPAYDPSLSVMVGDRWRDIEAGRAFGCRATILVDYDYGESFPHEPDVRVRSLAEAAAWILKNDRR